MLKKLFASMGAGSATVETELTKASARPGEDIEGVILITGGEVEQEIEYVAVGLSARVEVEGEDTEWTAQQSFGGGIVQRDIKLAPNATERLGFRLQVPWETPINVLNGKHLPGDLGLETELEIARARDKGDMDPVQIHPLPGQEAFLDALARRGFRFLRADLEKGKIPGATLDFFQEIEYAVPDQLRGKINEVEVTFLGGQQQTEVILEADRRGGWLSEGRDTYSRFSIPSTNTSGFDFDGAVERGVTQLLGHR